MNTFTKILLTTALTASTAFAQVSQLKPTNIAHSGGNGGDDMELELKKKSLQIGYFLKSEVGKKVFPIINGDAALEAIERTDIDVVAGNVVDKYGTLRTCVNEAERSLITCNLNRLNEMKKKNQNDVMTAMLFHEILGIMGIELGYQENVSMYPISSKILPYEGIISATPVSEANIRPEYFGLDNRSYGLTLINKKTNESVRMVCLNSNVEIHRCRNYAVVRNANGLQAPLVSSVVSISPMQLANINIKVIDIDSIKENEEKLAKLKRRGFKFITLNRYENYYAYGTGATQSMVDGLVIFTAPFDTVVEAGKQVINIAVIPFKLIINGVRVGVTSSAIKKVEKSMKLASDVLNLKNELSIVGKTKEVNEKDFNFVIEILTAAIKK